MRKKNGFTLVELLVVISIMSLVSSLVLTALREAREKAMIARAQADLSQIYRAMKTYELDVGELPPRGDSCPSCSWPTNAASWTNAISALMTNDGAGWDGPYLTTAINFDPWGNYYTFDDNACNSNCGNTDIRSVGPDGLISTSDDIVKRVTTIQEVTIAGCCY